METGHPRRHPPKHAPHPHIVRLRAAGWLPHQIAVHVGASHRAVCRWAAGDTRPLPVYEEALEALLGASPPKVVRLSPPSPEKDPLWRVRARVTQQHVRIVSAAGAAEAAERAMSEGWCDQTRDTTEGAVVFDVSPFDGPRFVVDKESP